MIDMIHAIRHKTTTRINIDDKKKLLCLLPPCITINTISEPCLDTVGSSAELSYSFHSTYSSSITSPVDLASIAPRETLIAGQTRQSPLVLQENTIADRHSFISCASKNINCKSTKINTLSFTRKHNCYKTQLIIMSLYYCNSFI